jgi:alkylation response protein AidB-like acyl-CoA dehydrogenase
VTDLASVKKNVSELADSLRKSQRERQLRRSLDPDDFDQLRSTGFHLTGVPRDQGGVRTGLSESTRSICEMLQTLARVDSSLALVASMHPSVMCFWTALPTVQSEYQAAWDRQTGYVIRRALEGAWWGTITSEPGTSGDLMLSKAVATPTPTGPGYRITGAKHFGSGSGMMQCMVTTAVVPGEQEPDMFIIEMPPQPWDGRNGARMLAPWDGHGMTATQSHSIEFVNMPAERSAWPGHIDKMLGAQRGAVGCMFTAVIVGIVKAATAEATRKLKPGLDTMKAFIKSSGRVRSRKHGSFSRRWRGCCGRWTTRRPAARKRCLGRSPSQSWRTPSCSGYRASSAAVSIPATHRSAIGNRTSERSAICARPGGSRLRGPSR